MTTTIFFFFNDTATTEIYTLSLHDALPIWIAPRVSVRVREERCSALRGIGLAPANSLSHRGPKERKVRKGRDRKSTRLNSSHSQISYAVFCLKKKIVAQQRRHSRAPHMCLV